MRAPINISTAAAGLALILLVLTTSGLSANPSFTIGSNPYLTVHAYPHDILHWPDHGVVLFYNPQTLPWQGDVTDINNRPSASYTSNYQDIDFAAPSDYAGNPDDVRSWMNVSSYAYKKRFSIGGLTTSQYGKFLLELGRTSTTMELEASGTGRAYETVGDQNVYYMVPFDGQTYSTRSDNDVKITYANRFLGHPVGFKVRYFRNSSDVPEGYIRFTRDGETYISPHLTWGWATVGCNQIFGYSHINTDAFYQDQYTVFRGHQWDLQSSFEINGNFKSGIRFRTAEEDGENYTWEVDPGNQYQGQYLVDEVWKDRKSSKLLRGYSKIRLFRFGQLEVGTLFFLQYDNNTKTQVNKLTDSDPTSKEVEREYIIETNPFINYRTGRGYLDFGLLLELARIGMENTQPRWNNVSQSQQSDVLWTTSPYQGWSPSWESFSKGSSWFFATGFEAYSSISVYKRLALLSRLTVLRKFTRVEKTYGASEIPAGGSSYEFRQTHLRNDSKNETWMTGSIGFSYGLGPFQTFLTLQLPLAYLLKQNTELSDNTEVLFEHSQRNMWQVQEPIASRIMVVYALGSGPSSGH
jgi:hypothetical protein